MEMRSLFALMKWTDPIYLRVWEAKAGRIRLYLLDADVPENSA